MPEVIEESKRYFANNTPQRVKVVKVESEWEFKGEEEKKQLSFPAHAIINVITKDYLDQWWYGEYNLSQGLFPSNYVKVIEIEKEKKMIIDQTKVSDKIRLLQAQLGHQNNDKNNQNSINKNNFDKNNENNQNIINNNLNNNNNNNNNENNQNIIDKIEIVKTINNNNDDKINIKIKNIENIEINENKENKENKNNINNNFNVVNRVEFNIKNNLYIPSENDREERIEIDININELKEQSNSQEIEKEFEGNEEYERDIKIGFTGFFKCFHQFNCSIM